MACSRPTRCHGPTLVKDRGYAWLVLVMSSLTYFMHHGYTPSILGNLTIAHQKFFNIDLQQSSLIGTVHTGLIFLLGPIASVLVKKLGCRVTQLIGGGCMIAGIGLSAFSAVSWHAFLLFGVIAAIGVTCCHIASSEIISQHFDRYKYLAFSLVPIGNHLGAIIWPLISQYLLDKYGYSKAMGIMASGHVIHIIAGICFFSPRHEPSSESYEIQEKGEETSSKIGDPESTISKVEVVLPDSRGQGEILECHDNMALEVEIGFSRQHLKEDTNDDNTEYIPEKSTSTEKETQELSLKDSFLVLLKSPKHLVQTTARFDIWAENLIVQVLAFLLNCVTWNATISVFFVLINDYILKRTGLSAQEVAWGLTIAGVAKVPACIIVALTSSMKYNRLSLHVASIIIYSAATILIAFSHNKVMYYSVAAVWGLSEGVTITNILSAVHHVAGQQLLAVLFGLVLLCHGIGVLTLTPLCTYVGVVTDEKYSLILAGCIGIFGSVILFPAIGAQYREDRKSLQPEPEVDAHDKSS